jgi:hypothetical protein
VPWRQGCARTLSRVHRVSHRLIVDLATQQSARVTCGCRHLATGKLSCQISHLSLDSSTLTHPGVCRTQQIMLPAPGCVGLVRFKPAANSMCYISWHVCCTEGYAQPVRFSIRGRLERARVERKGKPIERWGRKASGLTASGPRQRGCGDHRKLTGGCVSGPPEELTCFRRLPGLSDRSVALRRYEGILWETRGAHVESRFRLLVSSGWNSNIGRRISQRVRCWRCRRFERFRHQYQRGHWHCNSSLIRAGAADLRRGFPDCHRGTILCFSAASERKFRRYVEFHDCQ